MVISVPDDTAKDKRTTSKFDWDVLTEDAPHLSFLPKKSAAFEYAVRCSTALDIAQIEKFYLDNAHEHVDPIKEEKLIDWATKGRFFLITDSHGDIILSSAAKDYMIDGESLMEIGSVLSRRDKKIGYLYPFLKSAQVWNELFTNPSISLIFASLYSNNPNISRLTNKVGWSVIEPTPKLFVHHGDEDLYKSGKVTWVAAQPECLYKQAAHLVRQVEQGGFFNKATKEICPTDFSQFGPCAQHFSIVKNHALQHNAQSNTDSAKPLTYQDFLPKSFTDFVRK